MIKMQNQLIVKSINVQNFRGLKNFQATFIPGKNIIKGKNGTYKTSLLCAIKHIFFKDDNSIDVNDEANEPASIEITLEHNSKKFSLKTEKNKWYFKGIQQKSNSDYKKLICAELGLNKIEDLAPCIMPNDILFKYSLDKSSRNEDRKLLRKAFISRVLSKSDEKFDNEDIDDFFSKIEELKTNEKKLSYEIKNLKNHKKTIMELHSISSDTLLESNVSLLDIEKEIKKINKKLEESRKAVAENDILSQQIRENTQVDDNNKEIKALNKETDLSFLDIMLCFLTLGLYYFLVIRKRSYSKGSYTPLKSNFSYEKLKNTNLLINQNKEKILSSEEIKSLNRELEEFYEIREINSDKEAKSTIKLEINKIDKEIKSKTKALHFLISKKGELEEKINEKIDAISLKTKELFPNFDIIFWDKNNNESFIIRKNNVPLEWLNHSTKTNILNDLSLFFRDKNNLNTFLLLDNCESINKISTSESPQSICFYVTTDEKMKINEQNFD